MTSSNTRTPSDARFDSNRVVFQSSDVNLDATSAMFSTSTMGTRTTKNPAIRIYYVDPETLVPLEFDHYFLNLTAANGKTNMYGMPHGRREQET